MDYKYINNLSNFLRCALICKKNLNLKNTASFKNSLRAFLTSGRVILVDSFLFVFCYIVRFTLKDIIINNRIVDKHIMRI